MRVPGLTDVIRTGHADGDEQRIRTLKSVSVIILAVIGQRLKDSPDTTIADDLGQVAVPFADIVDFTPMSASMEAKNLVGYLNHLFTLFDELCDARGLEKIKTIGGAYMVAGGMPDPQADHVESVADLALETMTLVERVGRADGSPLALRIGVHTGPVVAGVIGTRQFFYDVWGATVNWAFANAVDFGVSVEGGMLSVVNATFRDSNVAVRIAAGAIGHISGTRIFGGRNGILAVSATPGLTTATVSDVIVSGATWGVTAGSKVAGANVRVQVSRSTISGALLGAGVSSYSSAGSSVLTTSGNTITNNRHGSYQEGPGSVVVSAGNNLFADNILPNWGLVSTVDLR